MISIEIEYLKRKHVSELNFPRPAKFLKSVKIIILIIPNERKQTNHKLNLFHL